MATSMSVVERPPEPRFLPLMRWARWLLLALALITFALTLIGSTLFPAYATVHPELLAPTIAWTPETTLASLDKLGWTAAAFSFFYVEPSFFGLLVSGAMTLIMLWRKANEWFGLFRALRAGGREWNRDWWCWTETG